MGRSHTLVMIADRGIIRNNEIEAEIIAYALVNDLSFIRQTS